MWRRLLAALAAALLSAQPAAAQGYDQLIASAKDAMLANPSQAAVRAGQAAALAARGQNTPASAERVAAAEWLQGEAKLRLNDAAGAEPLIESAMKRIEGRQNSKLLGDIMVSRGGLHSFQARVGLALADYQHAFRIYHRIGESRSQAIALLSIASLFQDARDHEASLKYYGQALDVYRGDPSLAVSISNNRGDAFKELGRFAEAKAEFEKALAGAREMKSELLEARIQGNLARLALKERRLGEAQGAIARGLAIARAGEARSYRPQLLAIAAELALRQGDVGRARGLITESFAGIDLATTDLGFHEAHYAAYEIYRAAGQDSLAFAHLTAMKRLDDQVWKLSASTNTALMAARFDSANQQARINQLKAAELKTQVEMEQAQARFQRIVFGLIIMGAIVTLGLLGYNLLQSRRSRIALAATNADLERALAAKTQFLATTSHEIRTPLNGILGMTQVMLADPAVANKTRERVELVHSAGVTMRGLVDDILDVAKMEKGELAVEHAPVELTAMLRDATRLWAEQARGKGLAFRLDLDACPAAVMSDEGRLRQLVNNLLGNAVKFTADGEISVTVSCSGERLMIAVADSGIGIAADKHEEIFEAFRQADGGTTRQFGGTGLGLAICRNIAEALGGGISLVSAPGRGATFTVELPCEAAPVAAVTTVADDIRPLLVVDANPISRAMLKAALGGRAGGIDCADSVAAALALFAGRVPDRIVADQSALAGEAMETAVSALAALAPLTVLWAGPDPALIARLETAGATRVVAKPVAGPALANLVYDEASDPKLVSRAA